MINILIIHEFPLMGNIISAVLDAEDDITVIGCGSSLTEAIELARQQKIDLALISSGLSDQGTLKLTSSLAQLASPPKIIILGITETRENVLGYIEAGASGYVLWESSLEDLLFTIRAVHKGKVFVSPEIAAALIQRLSEFSQAFAQLGLVPPSSLDLTHREIEVLHLLGQNLSNQEIAEHLVIEIGTVKNHVHSILNKLGVNSRDEAAQLMKVIRNKLDSE